MKIYRFLSNVNLKENEKRFILIWKKNDIDFAYIFYNDLAYISWLWLYHIKKWLINDIDWVWITWNKYLDFKRSISYMFSNFYNKVKIIDTRNNKMLDDSKLSQLIYLDQKKYNIPKSLFFYIDNKWKEILEKTLKYPFIAKDIHLDRWEWVFLINDENELEKFFTINKEKPFLFQEYIKNNWDWRVLVVWNNVLWWFKRYNSKNFKNNFSQWWNIVFDEIPNILRQKSLDICKWFDIEIWWIDFFFEKWKYYVIEINRTPQTNAFRQKYWNLYEQKVLDMFKKDIYN